MEKFLSTVPGLKYPTGRKDFLKTGHGFIEGRRIDDGAEGLWRIRNGLYDLGKWVKIHPGGSEWLTLTKGTDITEAFETHHLTDKAEILLPNFYVRDAVTPRSVPLTFFPDGFYQQFKRRATNALKDVDFHRPAKQTNIIADCLAATTIFSCLLATRFWIPTLIAGVFLAWTSTAGHNYLHARDNFRMYYMDLSFLSTREWRITHVMSHHMYTNTIWDHEIYALEPLFQWLPTKNKSRFRGYISGLITPLVYTLASLAQGFKRYYLAFCVWKKVEFRDFVPFIPPILMYLVAPTLATAIKTWMSIILLSSVVFHFVGFNAGHHHPDIFHDGDICR
ncbi:cytochrome b5-related protein [Belonocnema kinseyi]|uniref:cytochrome b5-related protein n=1 Tax=Belonocnema kinseyi TaxID=2817044 RepID=UPI00143D4BC8|nr:cytochrome b5-related protein [Belonocnema kinseyi]